MEPVRIVCSLHIAWHCMRWRLASDHATWNVMTLLILSHSVPFYNSLHLSLSRAPSFHSFLLTPYTFLPLTSYLRSPSLSFFHTWCFPLPFTRYLPLLSSHVMPSSPSLAVSLPIMPHIPSPSLLVSLPLSWFHLLTNSILLGTGELRCSLQSLWHHK